MEYQYNNYIHDVINNKIMVCKYTRLSVERHVSDLEKKEFPYYFSDYYAQRAIRFFSKLQHFEGEYNNQYFILEPWQQFCIAMIFGWVKKENDKRRFKTAYQEVARKNGKSMLMAGIGLYLLLADNEHGAQIYSAATKRDQAKLVHGMSEKMVKKSSELSSVIKIYKNNLHIEKTLSKYEPLGADSNTEDGLNVHGALIDEFHAHKTKDMYQVLRSSFGQRSQPLMVIITTAGLDKDVPCFLEREYLISVLEGVIEDDKYFGIIYTLDDDDNPRDNTLWVKSNPNIHLGNMMQDLQDHFDKVKNLPVDWNEFLTKRLNIWTQATTRWIMDDVYKKCNKPFKLSDMGMAKCYGGLDLSSVSDFTAFTLTWQPQSDTDVYKQWTWCFLPEGRIEEIIRKTRMEIFRQWIEDGWLILTPGMAVDYDFVREFIVNKSREYNLVSTAYDPNNSAALIPKLEDEGLKMLEYNQGIKHMTAPTKDYEMKIINENIIDGGNPMMVWMISCTEVKPNADGDIKPIKPDRGKSRKRIDGVVSSIMSLNLAVRNQKVLRSIYEDGVFTL